MLERVRRACAVGGAEAFFEVGGHHVTVPIVGHREPRVERVTSCWAGTSEQVR
jgi:hypothetical protein